MFNPKKAEFYRAIVRAREGLNCGDRLLVERCGGARVTVTMTGWDGSWICSKSLDDIAATGILKVNGRHQTFLDPPWEHYDPQTGRPYGDHGTANQALDYAWRLSDADEAKEFLDAWRAGSTASLWPEYYEWLLDATIGDVLSADSQRIRGSWPSLAATGEAIK